MGARNWGILKIPKLKIPDALMEFIKKGMARARLGIFPNGMDERDDKVPGARRRMMHLRWLQQLGLVL